MHVEIKSLDGKHKLVLDVPDKQIIYSTEDIIPNAKEVKRLLDGLGLATYTLTFKDDESI